MLPGQEFMDAGVAFSVEAERAGMLLPPEAHAELSARLFWQRKDVPFFLPTEVGDVTVQVRCEAGRWLVDCPFCASCQFACREDPRFFCVTCLNEEAGAKWLSVQWPEDVPAIEDVLRERLTVQANYEPGETVTDLEEQNTALGLG